MCFEKNPNVFKRKLIIVSDINVKIQIEERKLQSLSIKVKFTFLLSPFLFFMYVLKGY